MKKVTRMFSCLLDGSLIKNGVKSDGNPIIFLANAMEIHDLNLSKIHVMSQHMEYK